jgi:hypothetical protein
MPLRDKAGLLRRQEQVGIGGVAMFPLLSAAHDFSFQVLVLVGSSHYRF